MNVIFTEFLINFFTYCLKCERNIKSQIYPTGISKCSIYQLWLLDEINTEVALDNLGLRIHLLIADYHLINQMNSSRKSNSKTWMYILWNVKKHWKW